MVKNRLRILKIKMERSYEEKRQLLHHYVGNCCLGCGLEAEIEAGNFETIRRDAEILKGQLRELGECDLITRFLQILEAADLTTIDGAAKFRNDYDALDPKDQEFLKFVKRINARLQ